MTTDRISYEEVSNRVEMEVVDEGSTSFSPQSTVRGRSLLANMSSMASVSMFRDGEMFVHRSVRKCNAALLKGPRRFLKLCLFGFLLPAMLMSVPIYVRLVLYPPFHLMMAPTDQRLMDLASSSLWCEGQTVHMNGSFNAFVLSGTPHTKRTLSTHTMLQHLKLRDDVKEYWGFFLQKGSIVSVDLCNRYDGGMLMIMRGVRNLKKCAWIGEGDSAETDEDQKDTSNESGRGEGEEEVMHRVPTMISGEILMEVERTRPGWKSSERVNLTTSEERKSELEYYINKVLTLSKSRKEVRQRLAELTKRLDNAELPLNELDGAARNNLRRKRRVGRVDPWLKMTKLNRIKRELEDDSETGGEIGVTDQQQNPIKETTNDTTPNSSYEISNHTKNLYMSFFDLPKELKYERGNINQTSPHDTSNEEQRSSFSSSEEALTKCDGLIGVMPLYPSRKCHTFKDTHTNKIKYKIPATGTYYFVFSSDNEVFDSDMFFNMTLQRVVYDTEAAKDSCVNKTDCYLGFSFWSHDQSIVDVPEGDWNAAYKMELKCQPRVSVYLAFLFFIPVLILCCAFH